VQLLKSRLNRRSGARSAAPSLAIRLAIALAVAASGMRAEAEELAAFKGATDTDDHTSGSYSWQLEYRQLLSPFLDASFAYLNEGHLPGRHRDGVSVQAWIDTPRWRNRVDFAVGIGPYFYSDTQTQDSAAGFRNYHSVGELLTGSLTYRWDNGWFVRLDLSEIHTPGDISTHTLVLGAGYSLDRFAESLSGAFNRNTMPFSGSELGCFVGQTIDNSLSSPRSGNLGVEFRQGVAEHFELSAAWLNEGDAGGHRDGVVGEFWVIDPLANRTFSVGAGAGAYIAITQREAADGQAPASAEGVVSMTASWRFAKPLVGRITWTRSVTSDDHDRDIITVGLAWRWEPRARS
jgi:hypothetical protein